MPHDFSYLIAKIESASFKISPFKHIYIENFLDDEHYERLLSSDQIRHIKSKNDNLFYQNITKAGYKVVNFAGSTTNWDEFSAWRKTGKAPSYKHPLCESAGVTFRLFEYKDQFLSDLNKFMHSDEFNAALAAKFDMSLVGDQLSWDAGIQKYTDGYELAPHPDTKNKALTYLWDVTPPHLSGTHFTEYFSFKERYRYVAEFWERNDDIETCWVPWSWVKKEFVQDKSNSIVIFKPASDTLHGIKARFEHLDSQRVQCYGNLWFNNCPPLQRCEAEALDLRSRAVAKKHDPALRGVNLVKRKLIDLAPSKIRRFGKRFLKDNNVVKDRRAE